MILGSIGNTDATLCNMKLNFFLGVNKIQRQAYGKQQCRYLWNTFCVKSTHQLIKTSNSQHLTNKFI